MRVDLQTVLTMIGALVVLTAILTAALLYFKGAYSKARIEALEQDVGAYKNRTDRLRQERDEETKRVEKLELQVDHLSKENVMLKDMVTNRVEISAMSSLLNQHHDEAKLWWKNASRILEAIASELGGMRDDRK